VTDLPRGVREAVQAAWRDHTRTDLRIAGVQRVGGGCVSPAARLVATSGESAFLKWGEAEPGMFAAETRGLRALAGAHAVRVPHVLAGGDGWLLLEWLEPGRAGRRAWHELGRSLAQLHRTPAERYGADHDNFIGSLPQSNDRSADWPEFWRERRLLPQLRRTRDAGLLTAGDARRFDALCAALPERIGEAAAADGASLLHGDLWRGNALALADGGVALVDPSCYYGHREVDLAMMELFGGFDDACHAAYRESWPLVDGYVPIRRAVYQLYYLLVHVNLFGAGYLSGTRAALDAAS
jgi:protein-ribulosamine 3-kinase